MGLIGRKVKHYKFGEGAITQQDTSYVTVKFMTEAAPKNFNIRPASYVAILPKESVAKIIGRNTKRPWRS